MRLNRYKQARLAIAAACLAASPALFAAGTGNIYVSSEDDDVVEYRRIVLRGARDYPADESIVFLSIS